MITLTGHYSEEAIVQGIMYSLQLQQEALACEKNKNIIEMLKPEITIDGNQWCVLWGNMPEKYIVGFGDTPAQAIQNFVDSFFSPKK